MAVWVVFDDGLDHVATTFFPNLKSAWLGSCPDLTIKERTAAALALHGGH